ncbi:MAG: ABC transporter substrate-binding protein [Fimbriimonadaceae bacterium]|nr:ABC transporter substrate-binding protein [Alphaproteobacteria bacterium]
MFRKTISGLAIMGMALTLSFSALADTQRTTITDTVGRSVEVPVNAKRVLLGFYFEDFFAIAGPDAYDRVVAISRAAWHDWRNFQWQAYTKVAPVIETITDVGAVDAGTFSVEMALAARPDVAIIAQWQYAALGDVIAQLEAAGIPVVVVDYNAQTVEKHVASTLLIGTIMGAKDRAQKLADEYAAAVKDIQERVAQAGGTKRRVYIELGNKGPGEYGNTYTDHMWGQMIGIAGGHNIALGQVGKGAPLSAEYVLATDPEVIFVAGSSWVSNDKAVVMGPGVDPSDTHDRLRPYLDRAGWVNLSAIKSGEVHALYHGGARTLYDYTMLQYIAKMLYPDAFADIDPQANLERFFREYLPIEAKGSYMTKLQ